MGLAGSLRHKIRSRPYTSSLLLYKYALGPLLKLQGQQVRRTVPQLPEPAGARSGVAGKTGYGQELSILIVGDSSAAGVGVARQENALAAQIASNLTVAVRRCVRWRLIAAIGTTARSAIQLTASASLEPADVLIFCLGANDVLRQTNPREFLVTYRELVRDLSAQVGAQLVVINGLPPIHILTAAPQPLRWYLGRCAHRLDADLRGWADSEPKLRFVSLQWAAIPEDLAADGFHPGVRLYAHWAGLVAETVGRWADDR
jgi:lysophospholipase L1-like esterase